MWPALVWSTMVLSGLTCYSASATASPTGLLRAQATVGPGSACLDASLPLPGAIDCDNVDQ